MLLNRKINRNQFNIVSAKILMQIFKYKVMKMLSELNKNKPTLRKIPNKMNMLSSKILRYNNPAKKLVNLTLK